MIFVEIPELTYYGKQCYLLEAVIFTRLRDPSERNIPVDMTAFTHSVDIIISFDVLTIKEVFSLML